MLRQYNPETPCLQPLQVPGYVLQLCAYKMDLVEEAYTVVMDATSIRMHKTDTIKVIFFIYFD